MLYTKIIVFLGLTATSVLASINSKTVNDINTVRNSVIKARKAMEAWDGGVLSGIPLVHTIYKAHTTAETARKNIEGSDPFDGEDRDAVLDAYHQLQPELVRTMGVAQKRVSPQRTLSSVKLLLNLLYRPPISKRLVLATLLAA